MSRTFNKPAMTIAQQIAHLITQGMAVPDVPRAERWLRHVSYYKLSAYWLPFEHPKDHVGPRFFEDASFDTVTALYEFDRRLRLLVLDAVERLEVAVRGNWAYALAQRGGPHGYLDASLYTDRQFFHENFSRLARDVGTSPETYIDHYRRNYSVPSMPPVWMVAEMMSFGQLSRWYSSLNDRGLRNEIAGPLGLSEAVFVPLLKHLSVVRNSCAHHARLWNRGFLIRMKLPLKPSELVDALDSSCHSGPARIYNSLVLIRYLLAQIDPSSSWHITIRELLAAHPTNDLSAMGFPPNWEQRSLWL